MGSRRVYHARLDQVGQIPPPLAQFEAGRHLREHDERKVFCEVNTHVCVCSTAPAPLISGPDERISRWVHSDAATDAEPNPLECVQEPRRHEHTRFKAAKASSYVCAEQAKAWSSKAGVRQEQQ